MPAPNPLIKGGIVKFRGLTDRTTLDEYTISLSPPSLSDSCVTLSGLSSIHCGRMLLNPLSTRSFAGMRKKQIGFFSIDPFGKTWGKRRKCTLKTNGGQKQQQR